MKMVCHIQNRQMHRMQRLRPRQNDRDRSSDRPHAHLYHGHRRNSFTTADIEELTELRARQRTFEGAYQRTALGMAVYAIIVLKIFSPAFAKSQSRSPDGMIHG